MLGRALSLVAALLLACASTGAHAYARTLQPETAHRGFATTAQGAQRDRANVTPEAASENSPSITEASDGRRFYAKARYYGGGRGSFISVDPWDGDTTSPVSLNKYLYGYANPGVYLDPDGRQSITINVTSCAEDGSCAAEQVAGSALPFLSPSQMATPEQAAALAESQARARLFGGGRADAPMVVQPMLASGAGQFERPHVEYGSSRQLSAMQSSADLDRALGLDPNYANYAQTTEAVGEMAFHSLPPVAVASGVHTMATAENGWQFAGGAMEATFGAAPFAAAARGPVAAWRAEMAASRATQQARPVAVSDGRSGATVVRFNDIDGEFRGDQILHPVGQRPPPADPQTYSVAYEMELLPRDLGRSRQVHANRAMAALDNSLRNDPEYAALMEATVPGVNSAVSPTGGRVTPTGWTWEHASTSTADGRVGVMRLVPSVQHTPGSPWWRALHPDPGAAGGYSEWAIPRGAPKNH